MPPPFLFSPAFESLRSYVSLVRSLLIRKVAQLHRLKNAVGNHGRSQACPESQEEHLAALIAPQGLHGGVIQYLHWASECSSKLKTNPAASEIVRLRQWTIMKHRTRIANRHHIILPALSKLLNPGDHARRRHRRPRDKCPRPFLARGKNVHICAADVDNQDFFG